MRKLILLAAVAATIVPAAAIAREPNPARNGTAAAPVANNQRNAQRTVRANQQTVRSNRQVAVSNQRVAVSNQRTVSNQRVAVSRNRYVAPVRNWSYRSVNVGYQLQPSFYGSRYYISDYSRYHLSSPRRWERWIRYGDDLLLVNIRTGRVLRVIHYRYW